MVIDTADHRVQMNMVREEFEAVKQPKGLQTKDLLLTLQSTVYLYREHDALRSGNRGLPRPLRPIPPRATCVLGSRS